MQCITSELAEQHGLAKDRFPETDQEVAKAEEALANELSELSLVEHEKILFEVHGIAQIDDEDPPFIEKCLEDLEAALQQIPKKSAYEQAKYLNKEYVQHPKFLLMFLRCERFNIKLAAQKLVKHFEIKRELFGAGEILVREILLSDLTADDMICLETGFVQVLPTRDAAGRSIICLTPAYKQHKVIENVTRSLWYMFATCLRDEETQKKGVVMVIYNVGKMAKTEELHFMQHVHKVREGIPKKAVGGHYCYDDKSLRPFVVGMRLFLDKDCRHRFRPHFGSQDDIRFELQTYGIPTKDYPIQENGSMSLVWHREWLQIRKSQEESDSMDGIVVPRRFDVLFGRGKNTREHTGNLRAAHLVEMHQSKYEQANKYQKTEIAERIVSIIHESYGRFLKWEQDGWVQVEHDAAREKVSHFFRHLRQHKVPKNSKPQPPKEEDSPRSQPKRVTPCPSPSPVHSFDDAKSAKHLRGESV